MLRSPLAAAVLFLLLLSTAGLAFDARQKSISSSRQFIVYSSDANLRAQVANFAEEVKANTLQLLGETDSWKLPVLITLDRQGAAGEQAPAQVSVYAGDAGYRVQIDVRIGHNPAEVNLQKHVVRALFLEFAYRAQPEAFRAGSRYQEAPWWLVEGALMIMRNRQNGVDAELFRKIVETNRIPPLEQFLAPRPEDFGGATAKAVDSACAMCLVQLLMEQPGGRENLVRLLRRLPEGNSDSVGSLLREFPALAQGGPELQKWWTLNLARFSAADRYRGLSPEETDAELAALLHFEVPLEKGEEKRNFSVSEFKQYLKLPASRTILRDRQASLITLSTRANGLYRSMIADYERIFSKLARGKTAGVARMLEEVERYREAVLKRRNEVADYMNWFEVTQMDGRSGDFSAYIRAANEFSTPVARQDPVSQYLDEIAADVDSAQNPF